MLPDDGNGGTSSRVFNGLVGSKLIIVWWVYAIFSFRPSIRSSTQSMNRWPRMMPRQLIVYCLGHFSTSLAEGKNSFTS